MIKTIRHLPLIVSIMATLTACSDIKGAIEFADQNDDFDDRYDALNARSTTAYSAIPDAGTATYRGEARLGAGTDAAGVVLIGDASITVDFSDGDVTGRLSSFGGFDRSEEYSDYSGALTFEGGQIGVDKPNDVQATIEGTLVGEDHSLDVDAAFRGDFRGTPIRGILGNTQGSASTFTLDGNTVPGGIVVAVSQ